MRCSSESVPRSRKCLAAAAAFELPPEQGKINHFETRRDNYLKQGWAALLTGGPQRADQ